jgi:two-component system, OmpR family, sensor kinase
MRRITLPGRRTLPIPIRRPWIPYIILVISLLATIFATLYVNRTAYAIDQLRFESSAEQTQNTINNRLETYIALLRGGAGLLASSDTITEENFRLFVERLRLTERYPGVQGIGYAARVPNADRAAFEENIRLTKPEFTIKSPEEQDDYYPVIYLEPVNYKNNQAAVGYDMFSEPTRRDAMERARDTGTRAASGKVILIQENENRKQSGFLIYVPVYQGSTLPKTVEARREEIRGFVYSPFRADDLLTGIFGHDAKQIVHYQIYDGEELNMMNLLHDSRAIRNETNSDYEPRFKTTRTISVAGRTWTIAFANNEAFENQSQHGLAPFIFGLGLIISGVLFFLSRSQFVARATAERSAVQLMHSQKELQKAIGMRDDFISIASHELKTPVTSMKVYAEVMEKKFVKLKQKDAVAGMKKINMQIDKLTDLIQDLLDVTRIQSGKLAFHEAEFELSQAVKDVISNTQPITEKHQIVLKSAPKITVWGDKDRIGQVISNFLTNAIKYSPDAEKVVVRVVKKDGQATVSVQDFGIGIEQSHQKKIFSRFYRVTDRRGQTFPGLGIGLYICTEIIKRHNGSIAVESKYNKGSIFSFTLPIRTSKKSKTSR